MKVLKKSALKAKITDKSIFSCNLIMSQMVVITYRKMLFSN